jgi:hypothetical protein
MTTSYTRTDTETFSLTNAKYLASKVAADLHRCQSRYGSLTEEQIVNYDRELVALLHGGFVHRYEFGFHRDGKTVVCWRYNVAADGNLVTDENAGKLVAGVDVSGAAFYNYLWFSSAWESLNSTERSNVEGTLPFIREGRPEPAYGIGYWTNDRSYSSGGVGLGRQTFQPL